jgi:trimeric autotransporter adhesin
MKRIYILGLFIYLLVNNIQAQVAINTTGADPDPSAILDITSTTKGVLIPRVTTTERNLIGTTQSGLLVYDTSTESFWYFSNMSADWVEISSGSGVSEINDLSDSKADANYSIFLGNGSGNSDDGYNFNTGTGISSLYANTSGSANVAQGYAAMRNNTTGADNSVVGYKSMYSNTSGKYNEAVGSEALYANTSGNSNVAVGVKSLYSNTNRSNLIAIGDSALYNNGTGASHSFHASKNTAVGSKSAYSNTTGYNNTSTGYHSLYSNTSGSQNTALGYKTLYSSTTGGSNVAIGNQSMEDNTSGIWNTSMGSLAGGDNTTGGENTNLGYAANGYNETGSENTAVGAFAGQGSYGNSVSGCVFLGYEAGKFNTLSNKLYIDNSSSSTPLIGGDFSTNNVDINGTIKITGGTPGAGKVLTSDASGNATWEALTSGANSIDDLSDGTNDGSSVFLGTGSGLNDDGYNYNTAIGHNSLYNNTSGIYNTVTGYQALLANTLGSWNSAHGYESLESNTQGEKNSAFGFQCLSKNSTGDNNVGVGYNTLFNNSVGNNNTAIGMQAGNGTTGSNISGCVFLGYQAGFYNYDDNKLFIDNSNTSSPLIGGDFSTNQVDINGIIKITGGTPGAGKVLTSDANGVASWESLTGAIQLNDLSDAKTDITSIFIGDQVGTNDNGTNYNTVVGDEAFTTNISGQANSVFGYKALEFSDGGSNSAFGYASLKSNTSGDYNTAIGSQTLFNNTTGNYNTALGFNAFNSGTYSNSVAIGYNASIDGNNQIHLGNTSITEIKGQVSFTTYSDGRIKDNVTEDVKGLDFITKLRPVTYNINLDKENQLLGISDESELPSKYDIEKIKMSGFIAQEVEQAANNASFEFSGIHKPKHEKDLYGLSYAEFVVPLVKAVQELDEENKELKKRIENLEELITR